MSSWKQLSRLVDGLSLVAKEIYHQSPELQRARNGDLEALGKKALVAATDLVGLTSGKLRNLSNRRSKEPSVVFFDDKDDGGSSKADDVSVPITPEVVAKPTIVDSKIVSSESIEEVRVVDRDGETKVGVRAEVASTPLEVATVKRRRHRERKVPSTPMARAYG